jgi:micrococcal nuclease
MPRVKKKKLSWKKVAIAVGATAIIAGSAAVVHKVISPGEKVVAVIDGDTFKIGYDQNIRLFGADAPELQYCFGQEAKDALIKKISGKTVILKELRTDIYRRVMALVYLDGESINEYMVKNGFAESHRDAGTETDAINTAQDFAKANKLGIFSPKCYQLNPPNPKCLIKGNITQADGSKVYFVPGCNHYGPTIIEKYKGEDWFCSETSAKAAGFTKSPECP